MRRRLLPNVRVYGAEPEAGDDMQQSLRQGRIVSIDVGAAKKAPGVVAIYTGADLPATVGGLPCGWLITSTDGTPMKEPKHPLLAQGKVRYVGDQVAIVIAESITQAKDAAELIEVDYEVLPAVVDTAAKLRATLRVAIRGDRPWSIHLLCWSANGLSP